MLVNSKKFNHIEYRYKNILSNKCKKYCVFKSGTKYNSDSKTNRQINLKHTIQFRFSLVLNVCVRSAQKDVSYKRKI